MNQTDRIISNIGAIKTLLENFPMGFFERDGKTYDSAFDFLMEIIRNCGFNDQYILTYLIGQIYGFEGQEGYTINGLYENIKRKTINIEQNKFLSGLEVSIKYILMGLLSSIYTCSALPILPNKVFDYDGLSDFMSPEVAGITVRNNTNDRVYKLKIPMGTIDMMGMLSISPATSNGSLYYMVDGYDVYYQKVNAVSSYTVTEMQTIHPGETYREKDYKFTDSYQINMVYEVSDQRGGMISFKIAKDNSPIEAPFDIEIGVSYVRGGSDAASLETLTIHSGRTYTENASQQNAFIYLNAIDNDGRISSIQRITLNGNVCGFEVGNRDGEKQWVYLNKNTQGVSRWESETGMYINESLFGQDRIDEMTMVEFIATDEITTEVEVQKETPYLTYRAMETDKEKPKKVTRYTYVPHYSLVTEESPEYIVCYEGVVPSMLYKTNDMNAFIWYCLNRGNIVNQAEENHLMWDSRLSAAKNGVNRTNEEWNKWYNSKDAEGSEFEYNSDANSEILYPIIQIEKYDYSNILVRIPAQRYFLPKKREMIYSEGAIPPKRHYFNASVYRFDWEYLKNIQLLNPKLLLVRFIEHLLGFSVNAVQNTKLNITRKKIDLVLSKAIKNIIMANDMEVEDCWKSFSNEDFNDLLNEMIYAKYTSTEYNGEVVKARAHDVNDYIAQLNGINESAKSEGTVTKITKLVNDIVVNPGTEPGYGEWEYKWAFDSKMLEKLIYAVVMPIVESIFTPQVMLLMMINFQLFGIVNVEDALGEDYTKIMSLLINKILGLVKSIVLFIKDKIIEMLLELFNRIVMPMLVNYALMVYLEKITDWLVILMDALKCLPLLIGWPNIKPIGYIDEVDYADIVDEQNIPEHDSSC